MLKFILLFLCFTLTLCKSESRPVIPNEPEPGAERTEVYMPMLKGKAVGLVANHTSIVEDRHLADTLISSGIHVAKIFSPEHGFRGMAGAGDLVGNTIDSISKIPVISLYGSSKKPSPDDLKGIDVMLYDIQDVGVRFYTYISTMHYVMEACAEQGIPVIILDRPNPLGQYIDGPVLDTSSFRSFVGMHPVPVVYGMTSGELAGMINGEGWLKHGVRCDLQVVQCNFYDHNSYYTLPLNPSPNLRSMEAIYLYPSVCFFEGTVMSLGRGTDTPFRVIGHPQYPDKSFSFTPVVNESNSNPLFRDKLCYGIDLRMLDSDTLKNLKMINLDWLIKVYSDMKSGEKFFTDYFDLLAGNTDLRARIVNGMSGNEIRKSWKPQIDNFKKIRQKYLLYKDFE